MRVLSTLTSLATAVALHAQTAVTVQNGLWDQASTWDCNCVPNSSQSIVVMHAVQAYGTLTLDHPQVQVLAGGDLTTPLPENITINTTFINEGHVLFIGNIFLAGLFNNVGFAEFIGQLTSDGTIVSDPGSVMQVEGDLINYFQINGSGDICVTDSTINAGEITGTLDLCDWSPTTSVPPIIDQNSGTVSGTVTFCSSSACFTGVAEASAPSVILRPNPANDRIEVSGLRSGAQQLLIVDATGRACVPSRSIFGTATSLDVSQLPSGPYRLLVTSANDRISLPLVIAR